MKKLVLLLFVLFSGSAIAQTVDYYSIDSVASKSGTPFYKVDSLGASIGVEFVKDGVTYVVIGGGIINGFNIDKREVEITFRKYIKVNDTYGFISEYKQTISDNKFIYGNPAKKTFGVYEDSACVSSPDLQTELQFFIDNVIRNKHRLPIGIANFIFVMIIKHEYL